MRKSTSRQQAAVRYCEYWLQIKFDMDINNYWDCSYFLNLYLDIAKEADAENYREYQTYLWDKL